MFFDLSNQNETLVNYAVDPVIREYDRMVYLALSEFFFDSGMYSYFKAGVFEFDIVNEKVATTAHTQNPKPPPTLETTTVPYNPDGPFVTQ